MTMFEILIGVLLLWKLHGVIQSRMRSAIYLARKDAGSASHNVTPRGRPQTA